MKIDEEIVGFRLQESNQIEDLDSEGLVFTHEKSGARLAALRNDDESKVFCITFRTPPPDETGLPHIMEHSVLCGSKGYPAKEPFVELGKGSLTTFLNAMTGADRTLYPVGSRNPTDFRNLVDVYMDAVLNPAIYHKPEILKQEGWHYELQSPEGPLGYRGVVYNEMKGAYSSPLRLLYNALKRELFPDTPYAFNAGGDPRHIPELTEEQFLDFHRRYYHPSNAYIYVYGNVDLEAFLHRLDNKYLQHFDSREVDSLPPLQQPFDAPRESAEDYPVPENGDTEGKTYLGWAAAFGDPTDPVVHAAREALSVMLLELPGAPLREALLKAGLGDDVITGLTTPVRQPYIMAGLSGSEPSRAEDFKRIVKETLTDIGQNGIDRDLLQAGINTVEFRRRQAGERREPQGIYYISYVIDGWLYGGDPFAHLRTASIFTQLREKAGRGYFEGLIRDRMLNNPHSVTCVLRPRPGLQEQRDAALAEDLERYRRSLTDEKRKELAEKTRRLHEMQETPDPPEALESIPVLDPEDIPEEAPVTPTEAHSIGDATVLHHSLPTNGIGYLDLFFDGSGLPKEDIPYLSLLAFMLGKLDTKTRGYPRLASRIGRDTGGIEARPDILARQSDDTRPMPMLLVRGRATMERFDRLCGLLTEILTETTFTNTQRLRELIAEAREEQQQRMLMWGNQIATLRLKSYFSPRGMLDELARGASYYRFLSSLTKEIREDPGNIVEKLSEVFGSIFSSASLTAGLTAPDKAYHQLRSHITKLLEELPHGTAEPARHHFEERRSNEGLILPTQVQYVAKGYNYRRLGQEFSGKVSVLKTLLDYGYLWDRVRVQGGAYGCFPRIDRDGTFVLVSFRDPNLEQTLQVYDRTPDFLETFSPDQREMRKYIIGTIGQTERLVHPDPRGLRATENWLQGVTPEDLQRERGQILATDPDDIRSLAEPVRECLKKDFVCAVGNGERIRRAKELFESSMRVLD